MVEFGLKLADNKVSEWSEHYIDYETFKKILKKIKAAEKKFDELCDKHPIEAQEIIRNYRSRNDSNGTNESGSGSTSAHVSTVDLPSLVPPTAAAGAGTATVLPPLTIGMDTGLKSPKQSSISLPILRSGVEFVEDSKDLSSPTSPTQQEGSDEQHPVTERTSLLNSKQVDQRDSTATIETRYSTTKDSIQRTFSNLSDHLSLFSTVKNQDWYERQLRNALKALDDQTRIFDDLFRSEQKKVSTFYYKKLQELEERLEYTKETVAQSFGIMRSRSIRASFTTGGGEEGMDDIVMSLRGGKAVSPFPTHRKQSSSMGARMEELFHRLTTSTGSVGRNGGTLGSAGPSNGHPQHRSALSKLFQAEKIHIGGVDDDEDNEDDPENDEKRIAEAESIKRSLVSQYREAKLLHNFAIVNITGFVKIAKKFDKTLPDEAGRFKAALESRNMLNDGIAVETLSKREEQIYANWFCEGDIRAAKAQMLPKRGDSLEMDWSQLQLGYRMGMCAVLAVWVCWDCIWGLVAAGTSTIGARAAFPVFRACGGLLLLQWFWGCSVWVWGRYRVNYIFLFDLDPRNVATPIEIFRQAVDNTLIYMLLMLLYYKSGAHDMPTIIPSAGYPLALVVLTMLKLVFPLKQRRPMWKVISKVITAPIHHVTFFQTYIGDIFTSMVKIFQDMAWTICWLLAGDFLVSDDSSSYFRNYAHRTWYKNVLIPLLTQLPLLFRFNQCIRKYHDTGDRFPHLANAAKYALSQMVTLAGTFHPLYLEFTDSENLGIPVYQITWTVLFVSSSLYSFAWDVYMDWGLGRKQHDFLGPNLMYPRKYYYYCTIAMDLVLRFMWVLTLVPPSSGAAFAVPEYLTALSMMLELFRRTIWGFFRLENEHRSNASGYRRVNFVPLHFYTGHQHQYEDKKERSGSAVLTEVIIVTLVVAFFCFASVAAAQHANRSLDSPIGKKEL